MKQKILGIIVLFFLAFLFAAAYSFYKDPGKSVLEHTHPKSAFISLKAEEIYKGKKIKGAFTAKENYLGTVGIRFETYGRENTDLFVFRLKEKTQSDWYYTQEYESRLFPSYPLFPFGFPIIPQSKGKTYVFELESLLGEPGNAVAIQEKEPVIASRYKFSKEALVNNRDDAASFVAQKALAIVRSSSFQGLFGMLLLLLFAVALFVNIFFFQKQRVYANARTRGVKGWFGKQLKEILVQKNIILVLLVGSAIRILLLRTSSVPEVISWQFVPPFSLEQIIVSLQKQWFPLLWDIGSFFLLYKLAEQNGKSGLKAATFFFLHPITLWLSGFYGVLLNVGIFFSLLLATSFSRKEIVFSQVKKIFIGLFIAFSLFVVPVYLAEGELIGLRAILFSLCQECAQSSFIAGALYAFTIIAGGLLFFLSLPVKNFVRLFLLLLLCFLSFTPMFLFAYLWLPIAFGSLFRTKWYYFYSVIGFLSLFAKNILVIFPLSPITINYVWFSLFLWFCAEVRETVPQVAKISDKFSQRI